MGFRLTICLCLIFAAMASAFPAENQENRSKRDVKETLTNAKDDAVKSISDAGDAVVNAFKPTEKSVLTKIGDEVGNLKQ